MNISEKAMENHKKIFPEIGIENTLDEELMEILLNFNFDEVQERELITFVILLSQSGLEPQLKGHIQGNLNVGNDKQKLLDVVTALLPYIGYPRSLNAIRCINES